MFKTLFLEGVGISGLESEFVELALSNGFKGLDLDAVGFAEQVQSQGMERAARRITSAKLKIGSFRLPLRWDDASSYQHDLAQVGTLAAIAAQLGCTRATTTIEPGTDMRPYHENFELHRRRLAEVAAALAAHNMRLGIGFLAPVSCRADRAFQFIQSVDEMLLLLRNINAANLGLALDTWHWHLGGGTLDRLKTLAADKIVTITLSDVEPGVTRENATLECRRLPGDSATIDNAAILGAVAELRYDGPVSVAADKSQLKGLGREQVVKNAGASLDGVWKAAGLNPAGKRATVPGR